MVFECVGVGRAVFRPGLGVSPSDRSSGEEKAVSGVRSPPTPAPHLQRERAWAEPRQRDNRSLSLAWADPGPVTFLLALKTPQLYITKRESENL